MRKDDVLLIFCAQEGNREGVQRALAAGADVNALEDDAFTALWWAVNYQRLDVCIDLYLAGADPHAGEGITMAREAMERRNAGLIRFLVAVGADLSEIGNKCPKDLARVAQLDPLVAAVGLKSAPFVQRVLDDGRQWDDKAVRSALALARRQGSADVVTVLCAWRAQREARQALQDVRELVQP